MSTRERAWVMCQLAGGQFAEIKAAMVGEGFMWGGDFRVKADPKPFCTSSGWDQTHSINGEVV
jgi:hypothetical protein